MSLLGHDEIHPCFSYQLVECLNIRLLCKSIYEIQFVLFSHIIFFGQLMIKAGVQIGNPAVTGQTLPS